MADMSGDCRAMIAAALAVPGAYYFLTKDDTKKTIGNTKGEHHGANQEYKKDAEGNN